jgi:hypothetical protein
MQSSGDTVAMQRHDAASLGNDADVAISWDWPLLAAVCCLQHPEMSL